MTSEPDRTLNSRYPALDRPVKGTQRAEASERGRLHPASPVSEDQASPVRAWGLGASEELPHRTGPQIGSAATQAPIIDRTLFERQAYAGGFQYVTGLDEAGRGPLAGPVVAAAVILPKAVVLPGLRDSKQLTALQREKFFEAIRRVAVAIGIGVVGHDVIDRINILKATVLAMNRALNDLTVTPDYLLIDALTLPGLQIPQKALIKGDDRSQTIAAASVIAKVTRDRLMLEYDRCYPEYHFRSHKGYGTAEHLRALERLGPCPIHRKSFRRVRADDSVNHDA